MESNYEKQVYIARELFMNYDQKEMIRKFQLQCDETYLYLDMLDVSYRISRSDGVIRYCPLQAACQNVRSSSGVQMTQCSSTAQTEPENQECLDYQVVMTIYDVLCHSKRLPILSHEWCPLYALQVTMSSPNDTIFTRKYARLFAGKAKQLQTICEKIGGVQPQVRAGADVCWQFEIFPFFPVQLRFWDGDEEFEPKFQLLWDKNSLDFMHFETTYYAMGYLMERLRVLLD